VIVKLNKKDLKKIDDDINKASNSKKEEKIKDRNCCCVIL
jgi:hypothetical protein